MMPSWSNRLRISLLAALMVLAMVSVFGFLSSNSPAVAQGTLTAPTNVTAVSNAAGELTLAWEGGDNADSYLLIAVNLQDTADYKTATVLGDAAKTGTVVGLTSGGNYLGIVVALQATADGLATQYGVAAPIPVQSVDSQCSADDYDRNEWGDYPGASDDATPTWTLPSDNVASPDITLDHHVALQDAHVSGGCDWSLEIKNDFATNPDNLNPTTRSFNSSKGSRTPDQLTGIAKRIIDTDDEKCDYATQHDAVKDEYDLRMMANEQVTVAEWLSLCPVASEFDASTDKAALVALYNATDGPNWQNNRNWLSDRPIVEWSRVSTDGDGRVTGLWLDGNQLSGEIPPWLGNLTKLEWLRLDGNEFTGQIPNGLSRLSNVTFLVLSGNQLTGQIPSWLGNMTSLEQLGLSDNRLSGEIPTTLGNLPNLRLIRLGGNSLTGCIPDSLQPVADNDFNRLGLPVCQAEPTASLGPSTGEGPYSIVNNDLDYSYTISLTNAWDQEREGVYSRTFPWSQLRVTSQYIETGTNLKNFSKTVRSGLRDEWWPNASLFDISSVEEVQLGDVPSYRMRYRVQESPQYCLVDVEEAIVISDALPGYPKGFRVRAWMCESQVRAHGSERGETLDSFRIVTIPSPYYQQFIFTNGVTVKATDGVDPAALRAGADIVVTMLSGRQDLARCMAQRGAALAIIPRDQPVTALPEYAHLRGTYDFTGRSRDTFDLRGLGAADPLHPVSSAGEEQLLGQFGPQHPYYPYRGWVAVHEFAHGIQNICFTAADDIRWREFYVAALNANLYPGTHMMADVKEFFAAFSTGYFEVTYELGPDSTRDSLKTRFPSVFGSLDAIYGGATLPQEYREIIPR